MFTKTMELKLCSTITALCIVLCACQSGSSPQLNSQDLQSSMVDYTGNWMTNCLPINDRNSSTIRLELFDGNYYMEYFSYDGQGCNSLENRDFSEIETGTYTIADTVAVPSGVVAHDITLFVEFRETNGEQVNITDDQIIGDFFHRDGNKLFRATGETVGVAGVFVPQEINFSVVYYLQE